MNHQERIHPRRPNRGTSRSATAGAPPAKEASDAQPGNQGMQRLLSATGSAPVVQAKLSVGSSSDPSEREADRMADEVASHPVQTPSSRAAPQVQRLTARPHAPGMAAAPESVERALSSPGRAMELEQRQQMEQRFGTDFSGVRVHTDSAAERSAQDIGARAYTSGQHIVFGPGQFAPQSSEGRHLLAHELAHVVQQSPTGATAAARAPSRGDVVRRAIKPEDVAVEMIGREFELSAAHVVSGITLAKGTVVMIVSWSNTDENTVAMSPATVGGVATRMPLIIPKVLLRPVRPAGARLDPYTTGIDSQARAVEKNEADLVGKTGAEKTRLEGLLTKRRAVLNRKLIQETMFNRFDSIIVKEVADANTAHGLTGAAALDPNLVKAMMFEESELGTSGTHMEVPPTHPVKTRFNLGQVIDSSGLALLTMLEREHPVRVRVFGLTNLRTDLAAAQAEKKKLEKQAKKAALNTVDAARLAELVRLSDGNWETFIWEYAAPGRVVTFADAIDGFFASSTPAKNMDYAFWIHMMVLWLFEKKTPSRSWPDTIKAYNGSGKRAEHYRDAIVKRASDASAAASAGTPFVPSR